MTAATTTNVPDMKRREETVLMVIGRCTHQVQNGQLQSPLGVEKHDYPQEQFTLGFFKSILVLPFRRQPT